MDRTPDPAFAKKLEMRDWCLAIAQQGLGERGITATPENKAKLAHGISRAMQSASLTLARYASGDFSSRATGGPSLYSKPLHHGGAVTELKKKVTFDALFDGWASEKLPGAKTR